MVNDGKAFERAVETTLRLIGFQVTGEQLLGTKKVDLLAIQSRWGTPWLTAIECKDEGKSRGRNAVALIWADYEELVRRGHVNEVLLVTQREPTAAAKAYIRETPALSHRTLDQLRTDVMDFGDYLTLVARDFESSDDDLAKYYIPPRISGGDDLDTAIKSWIDGTSGRLDPVRPVALLGAYGTGKSSYSRWLASRLAQDALEDGEKRIPILIPLGAIGKEQSLEGLIGTHLTARYSVRNYSFARFMELNTLGMFVLILDGFDEMQHQISEQEVRFNFKEFSRLITEESRVILLGRPTAFESDEEHASLLHGDHPNSGAPDYQEIDLAAFGKAEMRDFVRRYLTSIGKDRYVEPVIDMVTSGRFTNIASRPVQLKMLAQVLPGYAGNLDDLDLATLYDLVVDDLIAMVMRREEERAARLAYNRRERRNFLQSVAYWMWAEKGVSTPGMVPDSLVEPYAKSGVDLGSTRRDLVAASPLHRGYGDKLHFPHRSFQEHLVAAEILKRLRGRLPGYDLRQVDKLVTPEVSEFLRSQTLPKEAWAEALVAMHRGSLGWPTTRWLSMLRESGIVSSGSPWGVLLGAIPAIDATKETNSGHQDKANFREALWSLAMAENDSLGATLSLFIILAGAHRRAIEGAEADLANRLVSRLLNSAHPVSYSWFDLITDHPNDRRSSQEQRIRRRRLFADENEWVPASRLSVRPLGESFVESVVNPGRYGLISPGSQLDPHKGGWRLVGRADLDIRWFSNLVVAMAMQCGGDGRVLCGPLGKVFVSELAGYAMPKSWIGADGSSLARHIRLPKYMTLEGEDRNAILRLRETIRGGA